MDHSSPAIENCTISDNIAYYEDGGGIYCHYYSSPAIVNCNISGNTASDEGGGIYCYYESSPAIENCTINDNSANGYGGGGIYCNLYSNPAINNCNISGNTVDGWGGGIYCYYSDPAINNCTISGNAADCGGGIYYWQSCPTIENCTISGNTADGWGGGIYSQWDFIATGVNNIFWANSAPTGSQIYLEEVGSFACTYSDIQGGFAGYGNIDVDPLFVDHSNGDFHLQSASLCIDAGNPNPQFNDPEDPANPGLALYPAMGTIVNDMGVYGGQGALGWVGVSEKPAIQKNPESYTLFQNYPNPFNPTTVLSFELRDAGFVKLKVYDITGQEVQTAVSGWQLAGYHEVIFNGSSLASGVYFVRLDAGDFTQTQKVVLMK